MAEVGNRCDAFDRLRIVAEVAEIGSDALLCSIERRLVRVRDGDVVTGERKHLCNAMPHQAGADDGNP